MRAIALLAIGLAASLATPAAAQVPDAWAVAPVVHRADPGTLAPQPDERGLDRALRLHVRFESHLPVEANGIDRAEDDDLFDFGLGGRLALEIPIAGLLSVGAEGEYTWWHYGTEISDDERNATMLSFGGFARIHALLGAVRLFAGAHLGGLVAWEDGEALRGFYAGPHAGMQVGGRWGYELVVGATLRTIRDQAALPNGALDPFASMGFFVLLEDPR